MRYLRRRHPARLYGHGTYSQGFARTLPSVSANIEPPNFSIWVFDSMVDKMRQGIKEDA